jgi:methionyl aminopeptidase
MSSSLIKEPWEIPLMRRSGKLLAEVAAILRDAIREGTSTRTLDELAEKAIRDRGASPSFRGYQPGPNFPPYPASICASVNEQVVHGIPNDRPLVDGDLLSLDIGLVFGGYHADCAFSVLIGQGTDQAHRLLRVTEEALGIAIRKAAVGNRVGDLGEEVQRHVEKHGFGIVRDYVGHGIGRSMHEAPSVPNYGKRGKGQLLKEGMCLALEPMVTAGTWRTKVLKDKWTVITEDGSLAAHFEHTVALTGRGPEILTTLAGAVA